MVISIPQRVPDPATARATSSGKAAIRQVLHSYLAVQPKIDFEITRIVQAGDIALLRSPWRLTGMGPDGSALQMAHESTDVARRQPDGSWKFAIDHPFGADPV